MNDSEPKPNWRDKLRRATHVDGSKENYVDPKAASERQTAPVANLNDPKNRRNKNGQPSHFATNPNVELDNKIKPPGFEI